MTPAMAHFDQAGPIRELRQGVLDAPYSAHPERVVRKPPQPPKPQLEVWINRPPASQDKSQ
jgi:putative transposase